MTRVLVCGGREFGQIPKGCPSDPHHESRVRAEREAWLLRETLNTYHVDHRISCLIHGTAPGADTEAARWACRMSLLIEAYPADWRKHGKAAGPIRNGQMLTEGKPDVVIAFSGGAGTRDMIRQAEAAGIPIVRATLAECERPCVQEGER